MADYDADYYDQFIYGDAGKGMSESDSQKYYADQNARLAAMPDPYEEPTWQPQRRSRTPKFSEWYHLPSEKRPPKVEGRKKVYDISQISEMWKREFIDGLGTNVRQLQANINGHRVIVNQYPTGDYVIASGNNVRKADEGTLDDVIEGIVE